MTDRELLKLARHELTTTEFDVWFAKNYRELGRYSGSLALGITVDQYRYRLHTATQKIDRALTRKDTAA